MKQNLYRDEMEKEAAELEGLSLRVSWGMRRRLQQYLDADNLTLPQYMVMNALSCAEGGCSMSELAERTHQVSATMTGIIDRLEERGLVTRQRAANDRRALRVALNPAGRAAVERINAQKRGWMRSFLENLDAAERGMIRLVLSRLLEHIENAHPAPAPVAVVEEQVLGD